MKRHKEKVRVYQLSNDFSQETNIHLLDCIIVDLALNCELESIETDPDQPNTVLITLKEI